MDADLRQCNHRFRSNSVTSIHSRVDLYSQNSIQRRHRLQRSNSISRSKEIPLHNHIPLARPRSNTQKDTLKLGQSIIRNHSNAKTRTNNQRQHQINKLRSQENQKVIRSKGTVKNRLGSKKYENPINSRRNNERFKKVIKASIQNSFKK